MTQLAELPLSSAEMSLGAQWSPAGGMWYSGGLRLSGKVSSSVCASSQEAGQPRVSGNGVVNMVLFTSP